MSHNCQNCDHNCDSCHEMEENGCPICGKLGMQVEFITVESLVNTFLRKQLKTYQNEQFYLCTQRSCEVGYYTTSGVKILLSQVDVPIWFKHDKDIYYICYCRRITLDDCIEAVNYLEEPTMDSVIGFLNKSDVKTNCLLNNPTSKSCEILFNNAIKYALNKKA